MLSGDNGILQRATDAKTNTDNAQIKERIQLAYLAGLTGGNGSIDKASFKTELQKEFGTEKVTDDTIDDTTQIGKWIVTIDGATVELEAGTTTTPQIPETATLPTGDGTTPYFPSSAFSQVEGTDLTTGLVITDHINETTGESDGNEYVWIEVPNNGDASTKGTSWPDYTAVASTTKGTDAYYTAIENALDSYTITLLNGSDSKTSRIGGKDEWYDYCGTTYDGEHNYSECKFAEKTGNTYQENNGSVSKVDYFKFAKNYYGKIYTDTELTSEATSPVSSTTFYVKITDKLTDTSGCGLTYIDYNTKKKAMLESIYTNGGFWIGRYETGYEYNDTAGVRTFTNDTTSSYSLHDTTQTAVIKANAYPYNWIRTNQAESLAEGFAGTGYNATLMFGIQWDLVLKYLSNKSVSTSLLTSNSKTWGNYSGKYTISNTSAQYSTDNGVSWNAITSSYSKSGSSTILSTASNTNFSKQNIYDLAGNVYERTLEHATFNAVFPCTFRGGVHYEAGTSYPVSRRDGFYTNHTDCSYGFRVSLY